MRLRVRRGPAVVIAAAFAVRLAWVLPTARPPKIVGDPFVYLFHARELADGDGYGRLLEPGSTAFHPVGYPAVLAGVLKVGDGFGVDDPSGLVGVFQAVLGAATVALVYAIGRRLFDERVGLVAAAIVAVFPNLVYYTAVAYTENVFVFGTLLALWIVLRVEWSPMPSTAAVVGFGAVCGLTALVRPFSLLFPVAFTLVAARTGVPVRSWLRRGGVALAAALVVLVPWTARNLVAMDAFVLVSTNLGDTLCIDHSDGATGRLRELPAECSHEDPADPQHAEVVRNRENLRRSLRWAIEHPGDEAVLVGKRAWYGYRHDHDGLDAVESEGQDRFLDPTLRTTLRVTADVSYYAVGALALVGLARSGARREPKRLLVVAVTAWLAVTPLYLYGLPRFHVPLLPFLALAAAVGGAELTRWARARRGSSPRPKEPGRRRTSRARRG